MTIPGASHRYLRTSDHAQFVLQAMDICPAPDSNPLAPALAASAGLPLQSKKNAAH